MMGWHEEIDNHCRWLAAGHAAKGTIKQRRHYLRRLSEHHPQPGTVTLDVLVTFLGQPCWGAEARKSARTAASCFYRWAVMTERLNRSPAVNLPIVRVPAGRPRPAPTHVLAQAFERADPRIRLMLMFAAYAGLRCCEISKVHTEHVVDGRLRVVGKGGRVRDVPLHPLLLDQLERVPKGWVFPGRVEGHLSPLWVSNLLSSVLGHGWTAHTLRHRFASLAYAHQRDLRAVQELLGHSKPETTARYTAVPDGAMRSAVLAVGLVAA